MGKVAFITGVTGQDGAYLSRLLLEKGYDVHGGVRRSAGQSVFSRLDALGVTDSIRFHDFEFTENSNVQRTLEKIAPDEIYNLAAQSAVGTSFEIPVYTSETNALGVMRVLEALRQSGATARFYQASTSEMFGNTPPPQDELTPFHPRSPYGVSKVFGHWATVNYRESYGLHASSGILFNHESPLRGREFVTRKATLALSRIRSGLQEVLLLGNLDAVRDWGFAGDYVEGMWRMLQADKAGTFVLATGQGTSVRRFVEVAAAVLDWDIVWTGSGVDETGMDRRSGKTLVRIDPQFLRAADVDRLIGKPEKAERELGWRRTIGFEDLVYMMVENDMANAKAHA